MKLAFELSGESKSIPRAEVLALFNGALVQELERVLVIDVDTYDQVLGDRLAMTHAILEVKDVCSQELGSIYRAAGSIELPRVSVAVRAKRIGHGLKSTEVEATIGKALAERGYKIDLTHPQLQVRALLSKGVCIIGATLALIDRSRFESRRPRVRPYFYPGVLLPRLARAAVNLTRVKAEELLLDPFCGTGGILLEAGLLGATIMGSDVDGRMVFGTKMNLDYYDVLSDLLGPRCSAIGSKGRMCGRCRNRSTVWPFRNCTSPFTESTEGSGLRRNFSRAKTQRAGRFDIP